ncbi:class I SAM-dependent methyltransferase [Methanolobus sp. ZRKC5]|uniref:class I SAM-dependent methyltransferase n=1 Tax=unclassified Methanolobus TaxID=2629569 RepID=UPI00313C68F4
MSIISKYNRFSYLYDLMEIPIEFFWYSKWRKELFANMSGRVLEVGVGTGKNIRYYPKDCEVVGIDISDGMLAHAKKRSAGKKNAVLFLMDAEHMGFKDNCFDFVVTTFVLCSIPEPIGALEGMKRVCKPEGTVINLEHMKSEKRLIAFFEDLFNPVTTAITGVNINRETVKNIKKAGLNVTDVTNIALWDVFRMIKSKP